MNIENDDKKYASNLKIKLKTIKNIDLIDNMNNDYYIHFSSNDLCNKFKKEYNGLLGNTCCLGKGVHIKTYNGIKVDYEIYKNIKIKYDNLT